MRSIGIMLAVVGGFMLYLVATGKASRAMNALFNVQPKPKLGGFGDGSDKSNQLFQNNGLFEQNRDGSWRFKGTPERITT